MTAVLTDLSVSKLETSTSYVSPISCTAKWDDVHTSRVHTSWPKATTWVVLIIPAAEDTTSYRSTKVLFPATAQEFVPRTPLGKALLALRAKAIRGGMTLLSEAEVLDVVKKRRGGLRDDATDIP